MPTVTVYSKPGCAPCRMTKIFLNKSNIPFTEVDISANPEAADVITAKGFQQAPVVIIGEDEDSWSGFRKEKIQELALMAA